MIKIQIKNTEKFVSSNEIELFTSEIELQRNKVYNKSGAGNDFLGWVELPQELNDSFLSEIEEDARKIQANSKYVVVVGIGGSYLGAKAVIDALSNPFDSIDNTSEKPHILYAGHNISEDYTASLLQFLEDKDYSIIVISKSGTTTEPAIAFRLLKKHIEEKYGEKEAANRIYAVTDAQRGALKKLADSKGYKSYVIADDVGGRFSVLSPVGLLPIAVAGYDIKKFVQGAKDMAAFLKKENDLMKNPASLYAVVRNILYKKGKTTEIMASYTPKLVYVTEWWKQLYGESEGKQQKGIFPAGVNFTTDLHSMGQYIQDGLRNVFETVIRVENSENTVEIPADKDDLDGLNYIAGKRLSYVNRMAETGTMIAHVDGGVPNIELIIDSVQEYTLGELMYFFEMACALSGYILDVNPFDQPGVEDYKTNMFALLEKPGFEKQTQEIQKRL